MPEIAKVWRGDESECWSQSHSVTTGNRDRGELRQELHSVYCNHSQECEHGRPVEMHQIDAITPQSLQFPSHVVYFGSRT